MGLLQQQLACGSHPHPMQTVLMRGHPQAGWPSHTPSSAQWGQGGCVPCKGAGGLGMKLVCLSPCMRCAVHVCACVCKCVCTPACMCVRTWVCMRHRAGEKVADVPTVKTASLLGAARGPRESTARQLPMWAHLGLPEPGRAYSVCMLRAHWWPSGLWRCLKPMAVGGRRAQGLNAAWSPPLTSRARGSEV